MRFRHVIGFLAPFAVMCSVLVFSMHTVRAIDLAAAFELLPPVLGAAINDIA